MIAPFVALLGLFATLASTSTPAEWRQISSIYQIYTDRFARPDNSTTAPCDLVAADYCGGTWQGIINQLDYVQGMGFDAIWISPVIANTPKGYHGYWSQDLYSLNPNFGTADDLTALSAALHARKMYLMVDTEANDMGLLGSDANVDFAGYTPFDNPSFFHPNCNITNFANQTDAEQCRLDGLPDLYTESPAVVNIFSSWVKDLVSNYTVDGIRVDAAKHVDMPFWPIWENASGVYNVGEVYDGDPSFTCPYQNVLSGVSNYPVYFPLIRAFQSSNGSSSTLDLAAEISGVQKACKDPSTLTIFSENADLPRFASYTNDTALAKNVLTYTILSDGIPSIYQGQEQSFAGEADPYNREALWLSAYNKTDLYNLIATLNGMRKQIISNNASWTTSGSVVVYNDTVNIAYQKGVAGSEMLVVLNNAGEEGKNYTLNVPTKYKGNEQLVEVMGCTIVNATSTGAMTVQMAQGLPKVFVPGPVLDGSNICVNQQKIVNASTAATGTSTGASAKSTSSASRAFLGGSVALTSLLIVLLSSLLLL